MVEMDIAEDDPGRPDVVALIEEHLADMRAWSPPCSVHALDLSGLLLPEVTFWSARETQPDGTLLGIGAVKDLGDGTGELKSMRTPRISRRTGAGRAILEHAIGEARARGWARLYLETGSQPEFVPARALYASRGFVATGPFTGYAEDPASTFMVLEIARA